MSLLTVGDINKLRESLDKMDTPPDLRGVSLYNLVTGEKEFILLEDFTYEKARDMGYEI